jgi:23S rRNA (adenine-N6)-dimethyltransferase
VDASRRRWGWHELDVSWARRLVVDARLSAGSTVVDIGAGTGAITSALLDTGARVIAVEAHPGRAQRLRERFGDGVLVVQTDAADLRLPRRPYHVIANPPFHVTSALLRRLLQPGSRLVSARLVLQEQAARKWSSPSAPGAPRWRRDYEASLGARVPRQAFAPSPSVNARVLRIDRWDFARRPGSRPH